MATETFDPTAKHLHLLAQPLSTAAFWLIKDNVDLRSFTSADWSYDMRDTLQAVSLAKKVEKMLEADEEIKKFQKRYCNQKSENSGGRSFGMERNHG